MPGLPKTLRALLTALAAVIAMAAAATQHGGPGVVTYGDASGGRVLVIGCVTNNPKYNYGRMQGIAEYVLDHMRDLGIDAVEVFTVDTDDKMLRLLRDGRVDWVSATPFSAVRYVDEAQGELLLAKSQGGRSWYHSVFVTRRDSGIDTLQDLVGRTVAFEKPDSTSAFFLPVNLLRDAGIPTVELRSLGASPPPDAVGYVFSGEEANSTLWVHKGLVAATAFGDGDWESNYIVPQAVRGDLKVFARSHRVPRRLEIVKSSLDPVIKARLQNTLLAAPADPDAAAALEQYFHTTGFREIDDELRDAMARLRAVVHDFRGDTAR